MTTGPEFPEDKLFLPNNTTDAEHYFTGVLEESMTHHQILPLPSDITKKKEKTLLSLSV